MNIKHLAAGAVATAIMAVSSGVQAQPQTAVTARPTNLRAGPATDYPVVAVLPGGFALSVQGCLREYSWCDVIAGQSRGWMSAGNINYYYQNSYVPVSNYGAVLGIGALAFILNDYWGDHYRDRRFYGERQRWESRRFEQPGPRYYGPAQRPDYVGPRGDRYAPGGSPPIPRADRRRAEAQRGGAQPTPPVTRREQRDLNQGGSSSVDPSLRPQY